MEQVDQDVYNKYLLNEGIVKKHKGKKVHFVNENFSISHLLGERWFERIININGDFGYVIAGTVRFWLNEKRPLKEFFMLEIN